MKEFGQALIGINTQTTSRDLLKLSYDLRAVGLSADEAKKSIDLLARNPSTNLGNPRAVAQLSQLGLDVGARLGIGDTAGIERLNQAIKNSVEGLVQLGIDTGAFGSEQASASLKAASLGERLKEQNRLISLLSANLAGEQQKMKTGWHSVSQPCGCWTTDGP